MPAAKPARRTMVITTTPSTAFGLDELNSALRDGWRILHLGVLEHTGPGEDDEWPDGHFSALALLEKSDRIRRRSDNGHVATPDRELVGGAPDAPLPDMSWPEYAI